MIALALALFATEPLVGAAPSFMSALQLQSACRLEGEAKGECLGVIIGVADAEAQHAAFGQAKWVCRPQGHSVGELRDVVMAALVRQPALRTLPAANAVTLALQEAFPCPALVGPK